MVARLAGPGACLISLDAGGSVRRWTKDAEVVFGHTTERAEGLPIEQLVPFLSERETSVEGWCRRVDGSVFRGLVAILARPDEPDPCRRWRCDRRGDVRRDTAPQPRASATRSNAQPTAIAQLCLIAREAITNAVRHGKARHIAVHLSRAGVQSTLSVEDDGVGIGDVDKPLEGLGLRNVRYRAKMIDGRLEIIRTRSGTTVRCSWRDP